jgi:hypothetical protein
MRFLWIGVLLGAAGIIVVGCGPAVPEKELGTVLYEVPKVPGSEDAYELPEVQAAGKARPEEEVPTEEPGPGSGDDESEEQ